MTERTQETENLKRAMILEAVESEPVKQGRLLVVTIGINEYVHWQKLKNAVQDAIGLQQTLIDKLGFSAPILPLLNEAATKAAIASLIEDRLREELQEDDNLVLFFAGHGHTRADKVGGKVVGETGFIVPVEARGSKEYWSDYIQIDPLLQSISRLPARHILVILDSCHSGFALGEAMKIYKSANRYEKDLSSRISRKVITSARREQLALDGGPIPGHSLFTGTLVDGFNWGKADLDGNGLITSSELGLVIQQKVGQASESRQTPDFGSFYLDDRGEMVISLRNQSFDALKARAFSALQSGKITIFKELTEQIITINSSNPETLYLEYRLKLIEGNIKKVSEVIDKLYLLNLSKGTIPISQEEIKDMYYQLKAWASVLELKEDTFPLEVEVLVGQDEDNLRVAEKQNLGEYKGYLIEQGTVIQLHLKNSTQNPVHVYMVYIDTKGVFEPITLSEERYILLTGIPPGETATSYAFQQIEPVGIAEIRLFSSPIELDFFLFPRAPIHRAVRPIVLMEDALQNLKRKSILYGMVENS